ncbi:sulfatase-like hydrolase/transferase [Verrucomicrobia bacterium]|nr:sulfatase-like hydrolase/transferase [Verrucomicrobiota bacterium]
MPKPSHALYLVWTFLLLTGWQADAKQRPNIVLVMADDQGLGDMGYTGHPFIKTPHFDKASREGLRFDHFYAAAPVCSPTRASVLTGRHPNRMGVFKWGYPMRPQEQTLPEILQKHGYSTGHFGKWHLGSVRHGSPAHPGANGFDHWVSAPNFFDNNPILSHGGKAVQHRGESSELTVDLSLRWIQKKVTLQEPFFAVVWFGSPHAPHRAIAADAADYAEHPKPLRQFYGEVAGMDRAFGKLRNGIESMGIRQKTLLWYCSDNGALPKVGSTGGLRGHKGKLYEGGIRVPSFLEWPEVVQTPKVIQTRAQTCDIFPTILDWLDIEDEVKHRLDGVSLVPYLQGTHRARSLAMGFWDRVAPGISTPSSIWMGKLLEAQSGGDDLLPDDVSLKAAQLPAKPLSKSPMPGHAAWIDGDLKLHRIESAGHQVAWELYDLARDPVESDNLLAETLSAVSAERVRELQETLDDWLSTVIDSFNGVDYIR